MSTNPLSRIPSRYWGYLALLLWGGISLFLLRKDAYDLDEGAAKALLLVWSVADQVASSAVTFGTPDLRILLYTPAGFLWTGNVFAAKVFSILLLAVAAWLAHAWGQRRIGSESALLATGLLLISPLTLAQIDTLSPGLYLLPAFILGAWLDAQYRAAPRPFGGWYFAQLFISILSVSLHPAGLAYPLALLWAWHKEPLDQKQKKYFFIGVGITILATLLIRMGWNDLEWLQNPIRSLALITLGPTADGNMSTAHWTAGIITLLALIVVVVKQYRALSSDFTGRTLIAGLVLGAVTGDPAWALIALCIILYFGFPLILHSPSAGGLMRQRGAALLLILVLSTLFMRADRAHYEAGQHDILSGQDQLIRLLAELAEANRKAAEEADGSTPPARLRVASQWPSRTMIACKCDTLPLPPATQDPQTQLGMLHSFTHLLFDPKLPANFSLARNLSLLSGESAETIDLQPEGVILRFRNAGMTVPPAKP